MRCYFFEYLLGWRKDSPNIHFVFGQAWHKAMDYLFFNGCTPSNLEPAYAEFLKVYRTAYSPEDEEGGPKTAANAKTVLAQYIQTYQYDRFQVEHIEIPGTVSISDEWELAMRLDLIVRNESGRILIIDHKTTTKSSQTWRDQWSMSIQLGTYIHCANSIFGPDNVEGALINGTVLRMPQQLKKDGTPYANSKGSEFIRVSVVKGPDQMQLWLDTVRYYRREIQFNTELLDRETGDQPTMQSFPCNPTSCTKYNTTCPYMPFCLARSNPLSLVEQYGEGVPIGFKREYWNPAERDEETEVV